LAKGVSAESEETFCINFGDCCLCLPLELSCSIRKRKNCANDNIRLFSLRGTNENRGYSQKDWWCRKISQSKTKCDKHHIWWRKNKLGKHYGSFGKRWISRTG